MEKQTRNIEMRMETKGRLEGRWECGVTSKCRIRQFPTVARHFPLAFSFRRPITPTSYHHIHFPLCFSHKQLALLIIMPVAPVVGKV